MKIGLLFPGIRGDQRFFYMPKEIKQAFVELDGPTLRQRVRKNTEWIQLTKGLLYYYGVLDHDTLHDFLKDYVGFSIDDDLFHFIDAGFLELRFEDSFDATFDYFSDVLVQDVDKLLQEQNLRSEIDYFPFTKQQLIQASDEMHYDRTPAIKHLLSTIENHYEIDQEILDDIGYEITMMVQKSAKSSNITQYLTHRIEIPNNEFLDQLAGLVQEVNNTTRMWELKGHTPHKLLPRKRKQASSSSNVISLATGSKVGRNDPCPCGSGKKFKKCYGG